MSTGLVIADGERAQTTYQIRPDLKAEDLTGQAPRVEVITRVGEPGQVHRTAPDDWLRGLTKHGPTVWAALEGEELFKAEIVDKTPLTEGQVAYALKVLIDAGAIIMAGGWGDRNTRYRRG